MSNPITDTLVRAGRTVARVWQAPITTDQPGHRARVVLEPGHWDEFDPFLLMAEDWFTTGTFGPHPHRGFETVTFVLDGRIEHSDNHGGTGRLEAGDAQWMTAGRGIVHAEDTPPGETVHCLQLWVNLPRASKMVEPRYQDLRSATMPVWRGVGADVRVFSGSFGGLRAPTRNHVPVTYLDIRLDAGASVSPELPVTQNGFVYVVEGGVRIGAESAPVSAGEVAWLAQPGRLHPDDASEVRVVAEERSHVLLIAGDPIREPVAAYGPFVMNTADEIRAAYADFKSGTF